MKTRNLLTAGEVDALVADLERRLGSVGIETQPQVAAKVIDLVADPDAGLRDYAGVVKADPALTGRLLRLANSAFFAQRQPVANLDRACVLLGIGRLKAVSLGFYLSRAAAADAGARLSRRIWGESVYRACLASELAHHLCPGLVSEAFVVGLMLDAGVPLLAKLEGDGALKIAESDQAPARQFRAEFETLPCTHVDVGAALARRWRLPEILAKPIERHHTQPGEWGRPDAVHSVHRIAYYVGALQLGPEGRPPEPVPLPATAERTLGMNTAQVAQVVSKASGQYGAMCELFRGVADSVGDVSKMVDLVQHQLVEIMDQSLAAQFQEETQAISGGFVIAGQQIEVEREGDLAVAYLSDGRGRRLLSYSFRPGRETAVTVLEALGIEAAAPGEWTELDTYLRSMAA